MNQKPAIRTETVRFFAGDMAKLPDPELGCLIEELEDEVGALNPDDFAPRSYEAQAYGRLLDLTVERCRRWDLQHPVEAEKRKRLAGTLTHQTEYMRRFEAEFMERVFNDSPLLDRLRGKR